MCNAPKTPGTVGTRKTPTPSQTKVFRNDRVDNNKGVEEFLVPNSVKFSIVVKSILRAHGRILTY